MFLRSELLYAGFASKNTIPLFTFPLMCFFASSIFPISLLGFSGFFSGLKALKSKSFDKRHFTVLIEMSVPCHHNTECIFFDELCGEPHHCV